MKKELSKRQLEVLDLVAQGLTNRDIGEKLGLAEATIKAHMLRLMSKIQADNRVQAVLYYQGLTGNIYRKRLVHE